MFKQRLAVGLLLLFFASSLQAARAKVIKLTPSQVQYETLQVLETKTQSLKGLELWNSIPKDQNIEGWHWPNEPDFKEYLLRNGLAELQDPNKAPPHLRQAQEAAIRENLGKWKTTSPVETLTSDTAIMPDESETSLPSSALSTLRRWLPSLKQAIFAIVASIGVWQLIVLVWAYFHRHRIFLILLGEPNTGKSWLCYRLVDPSVPESKLRKVRKSDAIAKLKESRIPLGRYEIVPLYTDIPGSRAGEQMTELLDRKWFRWLQRLLLPQKRIWLVLLAPAVGPADGAIDQNDLYQQLGALKMYVGVLASRKTPKPDFVAICIAKADLFMSAPPNDSTSKVAHDQLLKMFSAHTTFLEKACTDHEVKSEVIVCSALHGWGTDRIMKALQRACYTGK